MLKCYLLYEQLNTSSLNKYCKLLNVNCNVKNIKYNIIIIVHLQ